MLLYQMNFLLNGIKLFNLLYVKFLKLILTLHAGGQRFKSARLHLNVVALKKKVKIKKSFTKLIAVFNKILFLLI